MSISLPNDQSQMGIHPRFVLPGIENQNRPEQVPEPGVWCRPDWIRLTGPELMTKEVHRLLRQCFGHPTGVNRGAQYFTEGTEWHPGVLLSQGHSSKIVMVDLQGKRLATMKPLDALELTRKILMMGFRCTRIDLAVDHVMQGLDLYENALTSCKAKELCIMRTYEPDEAFKVDGTPIKKLLKLGQRESEVCARIYDKGLETKLLPVGLWERAEVEIKHDRANEVCMALVVAGDEYNKLLWEYVIGSVDFRECNGRSERTRRPRSSWWAEYIGQSKPKRIKPVPKESSLDQWCEWFRTAAARRLLQLSAVLDIAPHDLFAHLIKGLEPARTVVPAVVEAAEIVQTDRKALYMPQNEQFAE